MSVNRILLFRQACAAARRMLGRDSLNRDEEGTLAMAVQALDTDLQAE